jgi:hypothetical protein
VSNHIKTYAEAVAAVEASTVGQIIKRAFIETLNDAHDGARSDWKECYSVSRKFCGGTAEHQAAMDLIVAIDLDAIMSAAHAIEGGAA